MWEHGNIGQYWKGTREQGPPLGDPQETLFDIQAQALAEKNWRVGIKEDWDLDN